MNTPIGRIVIAAMPGLVATAIAVVAVWQLTDHEHIGADALNTKFRTIDERLDSLEHRTHPSTAKRFTSVDAAAMEARIAKCHSHIDMRACLESERLAYERTKVGP